MYVCLSDCSGKGQERFREVRFVFRMNNSKLWFVTLNVLTIIIGCTLIITFLGQKELLNLSLLPAKNHIIKEKEPERTIVIDSLTRLPRRKSNYTILNSKVNPMEFMPGDIPDWISCPPAVILPFKKSI